MFEWLKNKCFILLTVNIPKDPLEIVKDTSVNSNSELTNILSSIYGILSVLCISGAILSLMAHTIIVALFRNNPEKWAELKEVVGCKLLIVSCGSALTSICAFVKYLADSFVS